MAKWVVCDKCGEEMVIPTYPDKYKVVVHTKDAMSVTFECECGRWITANLSYVIIDSYQEGGE